MSNARTPGRGAYEAGSKFLEDRMDPSDMPHSGFEKWEDVPEAFKAYFEAVAQGAIEVFTSEGGAES